MKEPVKPKPLSELLDKYSRELPRILQSGVTPTPRGQYLHWDKLRQLTPPSGLDHEEWWFGIKLARTQLYRELPLKDAASRPFRYAAPDIVQELLHKIDRRAGVRIELPAQAVSAETRDRYIFNSLVEESITSSQLEGAATTRQVAADMIRYGNKPTNTSEQMIFNNFEAMQEIRRLKDTPLTPPMVLHLHQVLTADTLDDPSAAGRLQEPTEQRVEVVDNVSHRVLHTPPPAGQLRGRLVQMCEFANDLDNTKGFVHPIIRAIVLHFWLAYDHPFVDGNGRTARALFYWSMLSQGYWLFEFVSISRILREAPAKYGRSYLHTETDENDLTYFIIYQLEVILKAITDLEKYLERKAQQTQVVLDLLKNAGGLNHRQIALLSHAIRHPNKEYSIRSHQTSHNVAYATARADLFALVKSELLIPRRLGHKTYTFISPKDLERRLRVFRGEKPRQKAKRKKAGKSR
jgi:Fic family protein